MSMRFRAAKQDFNRVVSVLAVIEDSDGHIAKIATPVEYTLKEHDDRRIIDGTFRFEFDEAQSLFDALWREGLRPTNHADPSGEITRIEAHLQDMRRLVFKDEKPRP